MSVVIDDSFSDYPHNRPFQEGETFGPWTLVFNGMGKTQVSPFGASSCLRMTPTDFPYFPPDFLTRSALVVSPIYSGTLDFRTSMYTAWQLRYPPNPWEVAWVIFNYTDRDHFYYLTVKPNGWEIGKRHPQYRRWDLFGNVVNDGQKILWTGGYDDHRFSKRGGYPIGRWYQIRIMYDRGLIRMFLNGRLMHAGIDMEAPLGFGSVGFYNEDADAYYDYAWLDVTR